MYIELHTASAFSFLEGASLPEALVERAADLGYPALGLLDRDGLYGVPRFHKAAVAAGVKPIVGSEITIKVQGANHRPGLPPSVLNFWRLPILIETREGYKNLVRLITKMKLRAPKGKGALELDELEGYTDGLVALIGRPALMECYYGVGGLLERLLGVFGRTQVYVELQRHLLREEEHDNQALLAMASAYRVPVVATNGVRFAELSDRPMYDVLTCIRHKTTLDQAGQRLHRNAERYLKPPMMMEKLFCDLPDLIGTTHELANRLGYTMMDLG